MKMTAGQVYDATMALTGIISGGPRVLPQTAKYRLNRMYVLLRHECEAINEARNKLIEEYGEQVYWDEEKTKPKGWSVPNDSPKATEFNAKWQEIRAQELEVAVQPITLASLGDDAKGLEANEFLLLGELITE